MGMESLSLKALWGPRRETLHECTNRVLALFQRLASCDQVFAPDRWLVCGRSLQEAKANPVEMTFESMRSLLDAGRMRNDFGGLMPVLGFSLGCLWTGSETAAVQVCLRCGAYPDPSVMPVANEVYVSLPSSSPAAERVLRADKLQETMRAVLNAFDPDVAVVTSTKVWNALYQGMPYRGLEDVGWLTYLSVRRGDLPSLPEDYEARPVGQLGNLITIRSIDRLTASNTQHVEAVRQLSQILASAGLLDPRPRDTKG